MLNCQVRRGLIDESSEVDWTKQILQKNYRMESPEPNLVYSVSRKRVKTSTTLVMRYDVVGQPDRNGQANKIGLDDDKDKHKAAKAIYPGIQR